MKSQRCVSISAAAAVLSSIAILATGCKSSSSEPSKEAAPPKTTSSSTSNSAQIAQTISAKATVTNVNKAERSLALKTKDGRTLVVDVPMEVKNFDQIQNGDELTVRYQEAVAVAILKPGEGVKPASAAVAAGTAAPGKKPAGTVGAQVSATVRIESVDLKNNIVVFTPQGGGLETVHVVRPEGQKFIKNLKPGDQVEITYTTAVAVSVEKP